MAKKKQEKVVETEETKTTVESTKNTKKKEKNNKKQNNKKDKKSVGQKSKELYSELKKVSWPSFGKVVKNTGVVLLVVAVCTLLLFGADRLFYWLFGLLMG